MTNSRCLLALAAIVATTGIGGCGGSRPSAVLEWDDDERLVEGPARGLDPTGALRSAADPAVTVRPHKDFRYAGDTVFVLRDEARVDRHHFVDAGRSGKVRRLVIVQFAEALPRAGLTFTADGDSQRRLGGITFTCTTESFSNHKAVAAEPAGEAARTTGFLDSLGMWLEDELMVARFTSVNDDGTAEMVVLYMEPAPAKGPALEPGEGAEDAEAVRAALMQRAMSAFTIE
jgi:hypothetical protein